MLHVVFVEIRWILRLLCWFDKTINQSNIVISISIGSPQTQHAELQIDDLDHERSSQDLNMIAQRRRTNHLATVWTHSPRKNYSRITPEAGMVMKKASGMISPLWQGAEKIFRSPQSRYGGGGGYRLFRGFLIGSLGFSSRGQYIGGRRGRGGAWAGHTTPWRGLGLAALWPFSVSYSGT